MLGRCRRDKTIPVTSLAPRTTLLPRTSRAVGVGGVGEHAPSIGLGRAPAPTTLYVDFGVASAAIPAPLQRALLILEPDRACGVASGALSVELASIRAPWSREGVTERRRPETELPMTAGAFALASLNPLRIDVTELVRDAAESAGKAHGLALTFTGTSAAGACYSLAEGALRLELFEATVSPKKQKYPEKTAENAEGKGGSGSAGEVDGDLTDVTPAEGGVEGGLVEPAPTDVVEEPP